MVSELSKEYFRQKIDELRQAILCQTQDQQQQTRPVCVTVDESCIRAYAIVSVTAEGTTIIRVETVTGEEIVEPSFTNCGCECIDVIP